MTSIKVIPHDRGTQNLRAENLQPATARPVSAVTGSRALHKTTGAPEQPQMLKVAHPRVRRRLVAERRVAQDRRRRERRQQNKPVMLDTRTYRDRRRKMTRRRSDRAATTVRHGIDTEA